MTDTAIFDTAIFDVDGTLVDNNYQHTLAWFRAFRRHNITLPIWRLHRGIGMGGDVFVAHVAVERVERELGDALREEWVKEFNSMIDEIQPFEGARPLLEEVKRRNFRLVLASSGQAEHVETFLDLFGGKELADAWTTPDDATSHATEERAQSGTEKCVCRFCRDTLPASPRRTWCRPPSTGRRAAAV